MSASTADIGNAMSTSTDVSMPTTSITRVRSEPRRLASIIAISAATALTIHQNLFWASAFNVVERSLAAFGLLTAMLAGAAMALSSALVVTNALLLHSWKTQ